MSIKTLFIIILLSGLSPLLCTAINIVKDGKSEYVIAVSPDAYPITHRAAEDLQFYIRKATGVLLPIIKMDKATDSPCIWIGDSSTTRDAGINVKDLKPEGFIIKTIGKNLFIAGKDTAGSADSDHWCTAPQAGTWNGIDDFLEKFLDIRWFFPGEYGEYVPETKNLTIPDISITDYPKMEYRRMAYLWWKGLDSKRIKDVKDWQRRNRNGWSVVWQGSHTWIENFTGEDFFKEHPEWFAEVNGRRLAYNGEYGLQMCTTNPQALDKFAEIIIKKDAATPGGHMFSLSPNDSDNHCECKKCRALDVEKLPDGKPVLTDRYITYCNEIAKRVNKVLPDQTFGFYSYSYYMLPPRKTEADSHIKIMHVFNDVGLLYNSDKISELYLNKMLIPWKKKVGTLYFYTHPEGMGNLVLPCMHKQAIKRLFADLSKAGVTGIAMNNSEPFDASSLDNYIYQKMAWNPNADIDSIYKDALDKCYGKKAAPLVEKYFDILQESVARYAEKIKFNVALGCAQRYPELFDNTYDGLYEKSIPLLKKAAEQKVDKNQKYRLQMLIDNLEYCHDTVTLYKLSKKILKSPMPEKKNVIEALQLTKKRLAYIGKLKKEGRVNLPLSQLREEKDYNLPFYPSIYLNILKQLEGGTNKAYIIPVDKNDVHLDGKMDEVFWKDIPLFNIDSDKNTGEKTGPGTYAKVGYDNENIYIAVKCEEPLMNNIKDTCDKVDGPVWNENELEFFFDTENTQKNYKQICVNTLGTIADMNVANGKADIKWISGAHVGIFKGDKYWSLEMRIPLRNLCRNESKPGDIWGFNICRLRQTVEPSEYTCWSPTFGLFGKPERFGKIIFRACKGTGD